MCYKKFNFEFEKHHKRIQKIAINAGFDCPNRTGEKGFGGCSFCNNNAFIPFYSSTEKEIENQIEKGISFFSRKYETDKYLAYFQAYTNTNAPLNELKKIYDPFINDDRFIGIVIGTRPDCINDEVLDYLKFISRTRYIKIEYGVETFNDKALEFCNRGHTAQESLEAIRKTADVNLPVGVHFILGLPLDSKEEIVSNSKIISKHKIESIKLHQLQILEGTALAKDYEKNKVKLYTAEEYVELVVDFLEHLNPEIAVERFINEVPPKYLVAPKWGGLRATDIIKLVEQQFQKRKTRQGIYFNS